MIEKKARQIAGFLVQNGADPQNEAVYAYSLECLLNLLFSDLLLFSIALMLHRFPEILVWTISYTLLRVRIGGYHAPTHIRCILSGTLIGILSLPMNRIWEMFPVLIPVLAVVLFLDLIFLAPVEHERHPVSEATRRRSKLLGALTGCLGFLLAYLLRDNPYIPADSIYSGFACALLLALLASVLHLIHGTKASSVS